MQKLTTPCADCGSLRRVTLHRPFVCTRVADNWPTVHLCEVCRLPRKFLEGQITRGLAVYTAAGHIGELRSIAEFAARMPYGEEETVSPMHRASTLLAEAGAIIAGIANINAADTDEAKNN